LSPIWDNDRTRTTCVICDVKFKVTRRRHHCRKCGKLVCGTCSTHRMNLPGIGNSRQVCDDCMNQIFSKVESIHRRYTGNGKLEYHHRNISSPSIATNDKSSETALKAMGAIPLYLREQKTRHASFDLEIDRNHRASFLSEQLPNNDAEA